MFNSFYTLIIFIIANANFFSRDQQAKSLTITMLQYMKFGQNPSFGSIDGVQTSFFLVKISSVGRTQFTVNVFCTV